MGDKKNILTWQWPLISLEWIPVILGSLDKLIEPSWVGLQREMVANVANQSFGKRIFAQLQILLLETKIIVENRRYIKSPIKPNRQSIIDHLTGFFEKSSEPWSHCFRLIHNQKATLSFSNIEIEISNKWSDICKYTIFKQWAGFFQFIDLGVFVDSEKFIPESAITIKMLKDKRLVEKFIKSNKDPRLLTGQDSLHTESDFFAWTKGEDNLPISKDSKLNPRIPHEFITCKLDISTAEKINSGVQYWKNQIQESIRDTITFNLNQFIITHKIFIDYFLFGKRHYDLDFLSKDQTNMIKGKWSSVPNFYLSDSVWRSMPKIYNNVTRLSFSILYYRNSLRKIINPWDLYNEELLKLEPTDAIKNIPIRSFRTKRKISSFIFNISAINTSIVKLINTKAYAKLKSDTSQLYENANNFLPKNVIELESLLADAAKIIVIEDKEISFLKQNLPINFLSDCPNYQKLDPCYYVHRNYDITKHPKIMAIQALKDKLHTLEKEFKIDMDFFELDLKKWEDACIRIKETLEKRTYLTP